MKRIRYLLITVVLLALRGMVVWAANPTGNEPVSPYNVTYTALSGSGGFSGEGYEKLIDGNAEKTKWCTNGGDYYIVFKSSKPIQPTSYCLTVGGDTESYPSRNWKSWAVYAANFNSDVAATRNADGWVLLDERQNVGTDQLKTANRSQNYFAISNPATEEYSYYRIEVLAPTTLIQMNEFTFCYTKTLQNYIEEVLSDADNALVQLGIDLDNVIAEQALITNYKQKYAQVAIQEDIDSVSSLAACLSELLKKIKNSADTYNEYSEYVKKSLQPSVFWGVSYWFQWAQSYVSKELIEPNEILPNGNYQYIIQNHLMNATAIKEELENLKNKVNTYTFDPSFPVEPGASGDLYYSRIVLLRNIDDAGSVSGAGKYLVDRYVNVYAYTNTGYRFEKWTDTKGEVLSTSSSFSFMNSEATDTLIANYAFDPNMPSEPAEPSTTLYYRLVLKDCQGLTVSGGGRYLAGTKVTCSSSMESGYSFQGWFRNDGTKVSGNTSFTYTMPVDGDTLTAKCVFNPGLPSEPGDPILKHNLSVVCAEGGYYHGTSNGRYLEGTSMSFSAYRNDGYEFKGWYLNGELYTTLSSFSYTMGKENLNFYAKFEFNPSFPSEPAMPAISEYSYYLPTVNGMPGTTVPYSINLVNTEVVKDMNIRLTFPAGVEIDPDDYTVSDKATGYTITVCEAVDTISIIEEGARLWDFTFIGGTTEPATQALLTFNVSLPDTIDTGYSHQIKINQISMTMADGTAVTARTRNGRLGVYKRGDANGDNDVNVVDISSTINVVNGGSGDDLIAEVMDTNGDSSVDGDDVSGIADIASDSDSGNTYEGTALSANFSSEDNINHNVQVKLNGTEKYVAFQMDIKLPEGMAYGSITPSEARMPEASAFNVNCKVVNEEENIIRVLAYNMSNTAMSGKPSDPLFTLSLTSAEEVGASTLSASFSKVIFVRESDLAGVIPAEPGSDEYMLGDANKSGEVNVADITAVVSYIYGQEPVNFSTEAADVNMSGEINVADITGIVGIIYGGSTASARAKGNAAKIIPSLTIPELNVVAGGTVYVPVYLQNTQDYTSVQFDVNLPEGVSVLEMIQVDMSRNFIGRIVDGRFRIMGYSPFNDKFEASNEPIVYLKFAVSEDITSGTYDICMTSAVTSAIGEETIPDVQNGKLIITGTTGVEKVSANSKDFSTTMLDVVSLNGMHFSIGKSNLNSLKKGIYIINGKKYVIK